MNTITIFCPASLVPDANHLAMALGYGPDDGQTYRLNGWQDAAGLAYAVTSFPLTDDLWAKMGGAVQRPQWDDRPFDISITAARRAQALFLASTDAVPADPRAIIARIGPDALTAVREAGLTRIDDDA